MVEKLSLASGGGGSMEPSPEETPTISALSAKIHELVADNEIFTGLYQKEMELEDGTSVVINYLSPSRSNQYVLMHEKKLQPLPGTQPKYIKSYWWDAFEPENPDKQLVKEQNPRAKVQLKERSRFTEKDLQQINRLLKTFNESSSE